MLYVLYDYAPEYGGATVNISPWNASRAEIKEDIQIISNGIELLSKLKPKTFRFKSGHDDPETGEKWAIDPSTAEKWTDEAKELRSLSKSYGFIVDDLEKDMPEILEHLPPTLRPDQDREKQWTEEEFNLSKFDIKNYYAYNYKDRDIIAILTKALQETVEKVNLLESKIKEIENNQNQ